MRDYVALTRLYIVLPLAVLSYVLGRAVGAPQSHVIITTLSIALALAGGFAYNDLRDQPADRVNRPDRPLAAGRLSARLAQRLATFAFIGAIVLALFTTSVATIAFVVLLVWCSRLYSDVIKPIAGLKNVFVGVWCALLPWGASLDRVGAMSILPALAIVGLFVTQKELVADVSDRDGDVAAGVTTLPVLLGPRAALLLVTALNVLSWVLVRSAASAPVLSHLNTAAEIVAIVNVVALCLVAFRVSKRTVRAYLELQKVFMIGGCIALSAMMIIA